MTSTATFYTRPTDGNIEGERVARTMSTQRLSRDPERDMHRLLAVVATIARTIEGDPEREASSTLHSLREGPHYWGKKIIEEAGELWLAIEHESDDAVTEEASQLIYRILVGVMGRGVPVSAVLARL